MRMSEGIEACAAATCPPRMAVVAALAAVLFLCIAPAGAHAQLGLGRGVWVEVRGGGALPTGEFAESEPGLGAEAGPRLGGAVGVRLLPALAVYGGYSRSWFTCARCEAREIDDQVVDSGFDFGVEARLPVGPASLSPWIRAAGVLHQLTFTGFGSTLDSDRALGFRVGAGAALALTPSLSATPGLFYSAYSAELDLGALTNRTVDVTHLTAGIGLRYTF